MELPATIFITVGVIVAAFISGTFTFVNLIISKDQKTSEFRQDWINELRKDLSEFTSSVASYTSYIVAYKNNSQQVNKFLAENVDLITKITASHDSIRLRVNPIDDKEFITKLDAVQELAASKAASITVGEVTEKTDKLIKEAQILLKKEWIRVKKGEASFRITKGLAVILLLIAIASSVYAIKSKNIHFAKVVTEKKKLATIQVNQESNKTLEEK